MIFRKSWKKFRARLALASRPTPSYSGVKSCVWGMTKPVPA